MLSDLRFRTRALLRRTAVDAELREELCAHLAALARKYEQEGVSREQAERRARLEFGGLDQIEAECRDARGTGFFEAAWTDLRYAARVLRKDGSFTFIAMLTLAVAIGAGTTAFSLVEAVLWKPLPYGAADRIVFPWRLPPPTVDVGFDVIPWGRLEFLTFARQTRAFEQVGAFLGASFNVTASGEPMRVDGARVSAGFFPSLGVTPRVGRVFDDRADQPGGAPEVVLSDRLWRERFGADPSLLGRAIRVNGVPHTVVGVMPAGFAFPQSAGLPGAFTLPRASALWVPLALPHGPAARGEPSELAVVGRLSATAGVERAQRELDLFSEQMERQIPQAKGWFHSRVVRMADQLAGETRRPLLLLWGAVGLVLVIACANVANLLLARSISRVREFSLRAALGAGRGRLIRQLTTEHLLLAVVSGAAGLVLAAAGLELVKTFGPANVPRLAEARMDLAVLVFSVALSLAVGVLFGLAPAWMAFRDDLVSSLRDGGHRAVNTAAGSRARTALLVGEVALALVLVVASGLLVRTFLHLVSADAGFNPTRALTFELTLPPSAYTDLERIVAVYREVLNRIGALPGVQAAGIGETVPMGGAGESTGLRIADRRITGGATPPFANYTIVSPAFFGAVGTPILRGRDFLESDTADSMPVAIVNAAMARKYWPGQDALGKQVGLPIASFDMTVVGVVADVKHLSLREEPGPEIYVPYTQKPWPSMLTMHVVVRTRADPAAMIGSIRETIRAVDPELPLAAVAPLDAMIDDAVAPPRFAMLVMSGFAAMSLLLACVGLYGAVSRSVSSRTQELGIRIALGAPARRLFALVMRECIRITACGIAIGVALALVLVRTMAAYLYGVAPTDLATFTGVSLLLLAVSLLACYLPARRAMRVDPLIAMRAD